MRYRVLFVEDSPEMQQSVASTLRKECEFTFARTNHEAREALAGAAFSLVLLDLTLPDGDGFKICNFIRQSEALRDVPIIFVTGRGDIEDKEMAFSIGADDYIVKPMGARELRARVLAKLRRAQKLGEQFALGNLKFDLPTQKIFVVGAGGETVVEATAREFRFLLFLARHEDRVFSREQLLNEVWGENVHLLERTVDTHVSHLRKKLKAAGAEHTIKPVHGLGYKLAAIAEFKKTA